MLPKRTDRAMAGEVVMVLYLKLDFCRLCLTCHGISSFCRIQSMQLRVVVNQSRLSVCESVLVREAERQHILTGQWSRLEGTLVYTHTHTRTHTGQMSLSCRKTGVFPQGPRGAVNHQPSHYWRLLHFSILLSVFAS